MNSMNKEQMPEIDSLMNRFNNSLAIQNMGYSIG